ncbi:hypothetical protein MHY_14130 [Megamonas hypermegale ART12/1]|nr:hypothetical protein MHY_14130 [Megamonas hypermegale ART12/1]
MVAEEKQVMMLKTKEKLKMTVKEKKN